MPTTAMGNRNSLSTEIFRHGLKLKTPEDFCDFFPLFTLFRFRHESAAFAVASMINAKRRRNGNEIEKTVRATTSFCHVVLAYHRTRIANKLIKFSHENEEKPNRRPQQTSGVWLLLFALFGFISITTFSTMPQCKCLCVGAPHSTFLFGQN